MEFLLLSEQEMRNRTISVVIEKPSPP